VLSWSTDEETIQVAAYVVDMGRGRRRVGGHIVTGREPGRVMPNPDSLTGVILAVRSRYRSGHRRKGQRIHSRSKPARAQLKGMAGRSAREVHVRDRRVSAGQVDARQDIL